MQGMSGKNRITSKSCDKELVYLRLICSKMAFVYCGCLSIHWRCYVDFNSFHAGHVREYGNHKSAMHKPLKSDLFPRHALHDEMGDNKSDGPLVSSQERRAGFVPHINRT